MSLLSVPILVGVYESETQARETLKKLEEAGFNDQQIGMVMRKGLLMPCQITHDLVNAGIPEEDAKLYESEFQAGNIIILVKHDGRLEAAFKSLYNMTISLSTTAQKSSESLDPPSSSEADESLWRILKDAGLEHLL